MKKKVQRGVNDRKAQQAQLTRHQQNEPDGVAVLVNGPSCEDTQVGDDEDTVKVEPEIYETVAVTSSVGGGRALINMFTDLIGESTTQSKRIINSNPNNNLQSVELQDMEDQTIVVSPQRGPIQTSCDFDDCREYNYTTEDDDDVDVRSPTLIPVDETSNAAAMRSVLLGKSYHPVLDYDERRDDEYNLFWFTYRSDFPEIAPYGINSDAGWGCMLRSAQMMLGQALKVHFKSRDWKPPRHFQSRRKDPFMRSMLTWFADFPSTTRNFYSLHNMVAAGIKYDKLPGEWYGPQTACHVLRDLVEMHERYQLANPGPKLPLSDSSLIQVEQVGRPKARRVFRVHVASQGAVYRDSIQDLMTRESKARMVEETEKKHKVDPQAHPLDLEWEEELVESVGHVEWDTSLLLLIPARLGLDRFNSDYVKTVARYFSFPQSVGCLGGRVRGARWFYGAILDGSKVFGLDPHTVQSAPKLRSARINGSTGITVDMTDEYLRSCHTTYHEVLQLQTMDPSIALGFYCRNQADLEDLFALVDLCNKANPGHPPIFAVADNAPNYVLRQDFVMGNSLMDAPSDESQQDSEVDDDDFVML